MDQLTAAELTATAEESMKLLDKAETSSSWNAAILTIREARQLLQKF